MATDNPELQEKLQELEHELEVSKDVSIGEQTFGSSSCAGRKDP